LICSIIHFKEKKSIKIYSEVLEHVPKSSGNDMIYYYK